MNITSVRAIFASLVVLGAMIAVPITTAGPAVAVTELPAPPQSCSAGQPKLDYEYVLPGTGAIWSNVCGTGDWGFNFEDATLYALRMPTTPTHRVWLHSNYLDPGRSACAYSQNQDIYVYYLPGPNYGYWQTNTGDIQVSDNTASC